jgi:hypothetical protein
MFFLKLIRRYLVAARALAFTASAAVSLCAHIWRGQNVHKTLLRRNTTYRSPKKTGYPTHNTKNNTQVSESGSLNSQVISQSLPRLHLPL